MPSIIASDPALVPIDGLPLYAEGNYLVRLRVDDTATLGGSISFAPGTQASFSICCQRSCTGISTGAATITVLLGLLDAEAEQHSIGREIVTARLAEVLMIHAIRTFTVASHTTSGWLGALADPRMALSNALLTSRASRWRGKTFSRSYRPSVRLIIFGGGIENVATSRLATSADFEVLSYDRMSAQFYESDIDSDTAVVILFHDIELELPCLKASLNRNPFYLGAVGSARTHERRCLALKEAGYSSVEINRIKAPIGLFGRTRDANSLALSILADIASVRSHSLKSPI